GFMHMVEEHRIQRTLEGWQIGAVAVQDVNVRRGDPLYLQARLITPAPLTDADLDTIKLAIETRLDREVTLEVVVAILR
ncbi:MAG: hypothetical protein LPK85_08050, partial [Gammaproteobacteria bacterium]|nr:hypothetical protein [Gammaproteobacteria bacterium]